MNPVMETWKDSLRRLLNLYDTKRGPLLIFFPLLFIFFAIVNIAFYWWAMVTAFPWMLNAHYFIVQFPVGFLGALFDSFSFFVTSRTKSLITLLASSSANGMTVIGMSNA